MDAKELKQIMAENNKDLVAAFKEALQPAAPAAAAAAPVKKTDDQPKLGMGYKKPVLKDGATPAEIERFAKEMEIFELSETVDRTDLKSVRDFQVLAKEIVTGKTADNKVVAKKEDNGYGGFFTNQDTVTETKKATDDENTYGNMILAQMDKEDNAAKKTA